MKYISCYIQLLILSLDFISLCFYISACVVSVNGLLIWQNLPCKPVTWLLLMGPVFSSVYFHCVPTLVTLLQSISFENIALLNHEHRTISCWGHMLTSSKAIGSLVCRPTCPMGRSHLTLTSSWVSCCSRVEKKRLSLIYAKEWPREWIKLIIKFLPKRGKLLLNKVSNTSISLIFHPGNC